MNWLTNNPIANLPGPEFLGFFFCVAVLTIITCWLMVRNTDKSNSLPPLQIPQTPDPYEIAYMRGQENEVIRLAIFNLFSKGYLEMGTSYIVKKPTHPDPSFLPNVEKSLFGWISQQNTTVTENSVTININGVKTYELFSNMKDRAANYCDGYKANLEKNRLVVSETVKEVAWGVGTAGSFILFSLAAYKIGIAVSRGIDNFIFLIILSIISFIALVIACKPSRLSKRGKKYLKELQEAFANLARAEKMNTTSPGYDPQVPVLAMAVFGVGVLAGTSFAPFEQTFHRSVSSGGSCGGGCGSSSCGSSGGSSCGGGGGCGGCGGGGGCS